MWATSPRVGRVGRPSSPGEGSGQVAEQPGPPQATAADHDAGDPGLLDHAQRVGGLPDVAVAEDGDVHRLDEPADRVPVGAAGVGLLHGPPVQGDGRSARLLGDPARVEIGEVVVVEALAGLHRDRHVVRRSGADRRGRMSASRPRFQGSAPPPPLRVTFGTGQPKLRSTWATP